jgi:hypothetical protein
MITDVTRAAVAEVAEAYDAEHRIQRRQTFDTPGIHE